MQIPEGKQTVTTEGGDLRKAIAMAAEELSIHPSQVDHKLDLDHFRSALGTSVSRSTVKIIAWASERDISEEPPRPARKPREDRGDREERDSRRSRDRGDRGDRRSDRGDRGDRRSRRDDDRGRGRSRGREERSERRGPAEGETEASQFAAEWFATTLKHMDVEAEITATGDDERVHVAITAERAGRIVGKRGATLRAIRHLVGLAIEQQFGERTIDVDVGDDRPREERSERRSRDRDDRGDRGDRRGRGRGRSRGGRESKHPESKLRALARRAAEKAAETGQTITINLKLNSYDRRLMHLEISEIDGVDSHSEEREEDGEIVKYIQVIPAED